ncbi:MAG: hypothetical protein PGN25_05710 [Methylorubrum populi]
MFDDLPPAARSLAYLPQALADAARRSPDPRVSAAGDALRALGDRLRLDGAEGTAPLDLARDRNTRIGEH